MKQEKNMNSDRGVMVDGKEYRNPFNPDPIDAYIASRPSDERIEEIRTLFQEMTKPGHPPLINIKLSIGLELLSAIDTLREELKFQTQQAQTHAGFRLDALIERDQITDMLEREYKYIKNLQTEMSELLDYQGKVYESLRKLREVSIQAKADLDLSLIKGVQQPLTVEYVLHARRLLSESLPEIEKNTEELKKKYDERMNVDPTKTA